MSLRIFCIQMFLFSFSSQPASCHESAFIFTMFLSMNDPKMFWVVFFFFQMGKYSPLKCSHFGFGRRQAAKQMGYEKAMQL